MRKARLKGKGEGKEEKRGGRGRGKNGAARPGTKGGGDKGVREAREWVMTPGRGRGHQGGGGCGPASAAPIGLPTRTFSTTFAISFRYHSSL